MSTKLLVGGAALAGASYYVYQTRLDQAQQPEHHSWSLPGLGSSSSKIGEGPGEKTGRHIDEAAATARDKLKDLQYDAGKKIDSGLSQLEREKAKVSNWTSEKLDDLSDSLDSKAQDAKHNADVLYDRAHRDDPKGLKKLGHDIKQTAIDAKHGTEEKLHHAKDSVVGGVSSIKNTIVGEKNRAEHELSKATDRGSGWFSSNKSDALARDAQNSLRGWGETAEQSADAYHESLHGNKSGGLFSWGSRNSEDSVNAAYNEAKRAYNDAQRRYNSSKPSWFSWNQDDAAKRLHEEAKQQLDYAERQFNNSSNKLNEWKHRARHAFKPRTPGSNRFYDWLRDGYPADQTHSIDRTAHQSIRGWGDSAEEFSRERAHESRHNTGWFSKDNSAVDGDHVQRKLNSWERWANKKYDQTAQGAQEYYDDASAALKDAEREARGTGNHWWSWGSRKSSELDYETRKNLQDAQNRVSEATENLSSWSSEKARHLNKKFWSGADTAIQETKKGVDALNQKTLDGLDGAQGWVKEQK